MKRAIPFKGHFSYYKRCHYLYLRNTAYIMCEVNYNGRTSYMSKYFCCRIRLEGLLYDTERGLSAIAN